MAENNEQEHTDIPGMLSDYFNGGRNDEVMSLKQDEMYRLLHDLEETPYWIAILKYVQQRLLVAQSSINTIDPIRDATGIARNQGAMIGLVDLQNAVIQLVEERKRKQTEGQQGT